MDIVVLAGGISSERNVSLSSGSLVCRALRSRGHRAVMIDAFLGLDGYDGTMEELFDHSEEDDIHIVSTEVPDIESVKNKRSAEVKGFFGNRVLEACLFADAVFIALHGGEGEDGRVQAVLDLMGIKYTGTGPLGSGIAMDKDLTKRLLSASGIKVPKGIMLEFEKENLSNIPVDLPCVIKPVNGGSSIGVSIVRTQNELMGALSECAKYDKRAIVEEYIEGREFTIAVLDGAALPPVEIIPDGFYDYRNKYQAGAAKEICPAEIDKEINEKLSQLAVKVHNALGLGGYSRMEFILRSDGELFCLEANTLPGMTPTSLLPQEALAVGMSYEELCEKLIFMAIAK